MEKSARSALQARAAARLGQGEVEQAALLRGAVGVSALRGGSSAADRTRFIALERNSLPGKANAIPGKFAGVVHQEIDPVSLRSRGQGLRKQPRSETSASSPEPAQTV
ncbi:MAG: hypothetical protein MZV70_53815 [Desulfobacterales bacterium]|nr:hypothetical protein [Desulfobacterales bacterium]